MSDTSAPPRPATVFQVGVTGHRQSTIDPAQLGPTAAALFRELGNEVRRLHAADQSQPLPLYTAAIPRLRCMCGLAQGTDSTIADAALAEGWDLVAVLPFEPDAYAADFEAAATTTYRSLLARAAAVCVLDGDRTDGLAYAAVGDVLAEQSDVLLAVWDGLPARGPGGTAEVVQEALRRGLPVFVVSPTDLSRGSWQGAPPGGLAAIAGAAQLPPANEDGFPHTYFAERPGGAGWAKAALQFYERVVGAGADHVTAHVATQVAADPSPPGEAGPATASLDRAFQTADRLASDHAARYRAAGLMRYGLILPATLASLVGWYGASWLQPIGNLAQFAILVFIVSFSRRGWWAPSHRRFTAYRALTEYLRNARLLASLGAVAEAPQAPAPIGTRFEPAADWTEWYRRAVIREIGLGAERFDAARVAVAAAFIRAEAAGQIGFLLRRAERFEMMAGRLGEIGRALVMCGIGFSAIRAGLLLAGSPGGVLRGFNEMALVLPAMAPVFLGLLSFNEYSTLAARYRAVAVALQDLVRMIDAAPPRRAAMLPIARQIGEVMLAESGDWTRLIKAQKMSAY